MRFTNRAIDALKPKTKRFEVWADGHRRFGLRVSPAGRKIFIYMYRFGGTARRMTLGRYPAMGLADAHLAHVEANKKREMGIDPGAEMIGKPRAVRDAETVADLFGEYMKRHSRPNKKSADADQRLFDKDVLPAWGERKAKSLTRRDAIVPIDGIVDRGSPVMANRALSALKRIWNFGLDRDILDATPFSRIKPPTKETPRDRVLSTAEIGAFWNGLRDTGPVAVPFRPGCSFRRLFVRKPRGFSGLRRVFPAWIVKAIDVFQDSDLNGPAGWPGMPHPG